MEFLTKVRWVYEILAGRKDRYWQMFNAFDLDNPEYKSAISDEISWAMQNLKREDRIVWFLKQFRLAEYAMQKLEEGSEAGSESALRPGVDVDKLLRKDLGGEPSEQQLQDIVDDALGIGPDDPLKEKLLTYLDEAEQHGYTSITNFEFKPDYSIDQIFSNLERLNAKEKKTGPKRYVRPLKSDKVVLKFPDGWAWYSLERAVCEREGEALHHCGNIDTKDHDDNIYSLREPVKYKGMNMVKPHDVHRQQRHAGSDERLRERKARPETPQVHSPLSQTRSRKILPRRWA